MGMTFEDLISLCTEIKDYMKKQLLSKKDFKDYVNNNLVTKKEFDEYIKSNITPTLECTEKDTFRECKMSINSLLDLIIEIKSLPNYGTSWIIDIDSKSEPTEPFCCTDRDMLTFLSKIIVERELFSHLFIGQMNWKIRGTNVIDKIFDSTISATKLPGSRERYFIETYDSVNGKREFMYKIDQC